MKPIARYENRYMIGSCGSVLNLANNTPLTPIEHDNGYLVVGLADGKGGHKVFAIHQLVALHYLPNPYQYPQVNHKDGNKHNNDKSNLEWCDAQFNVNHALETGLRPGYMSANDKEAYLKRALNGESVPAIASEIGRTPETLSKMLRETAKRLGIHDQWVAAMKESRRNAAIRNIAKANA